MQPTDWAKHWFMAKEIERQRATGFIDEEQYQRHRELLCRVHPGCRSLTVGASGTADGPENFITYSEQDKQWRAHSALTTARAPGSC
eukprot:SAG31_NODE_631_length_13367_cov_6.190648_11_plen_87_part_00